MTAQAEMMDKFNSLVTEVDNAYDRVRELLATRQWAKACEAMTAITTRQSQVSVAMRSAFLKAGYIKEVK